MKKRSKFDHNKTQKDFHFIFELLFVISNNAYLHIFIYISINKLKLSRIIGRKISHRLDFFLNK